MRRVRRPVDADELPLRDAHDRGLALARGPREQREFAEEALRRVPPCGVVFGKS